MSIYGQSNVSMIASPVVSANGSRVFYNAFATFSEDSKVSNYTLVDGVTYVSTGATGSSTTSPQVKCAGAEFDEILPVNTIIAAINEATPIASSGDSAIHCSSGSMFKVSIGDFDFVLCALGSSGFSIQGSDLDIEVEYLEKYVDMTSLLVKSGKLPDCTAKAQVSVVTSVGKSLLTGEPIAPTNSRNLKAEFDFSFFHKSKCSCRSTPRPCIFMHGLRVPEEIARNEETFSRYWGTYLPDQAPCCSSMKFAHLNTMNYSWTDETRQQLVCDRVLAVSRTSTDFVVADTIVVTHSMGGLLLAGAIANGLCSLASNSTWVSMAAPMAGSMGSDYNQASCAGKSNFIVNTLVRMHNECPVGRAVRSLAYENGEYSSKGLKAAYRAAQQAYRTNVSAAMCSENYAGLISTYQAYFWVLGHMIPHKSSDNDGMVEFQSCAAGMSRKRFGNSYLNRFYVTRLNHYDMTFRSGDALFSKAKMPMKWFECLL
ncbi:hypothetical protein PR002_g25897 [Phytophthora rubi]|nr:hypothetical protein PR002_g25897 [Phytophthora rubi]